IVWEDKQANQRRIQALLESQPPEAGALVVLPEMFATGFSMKVPRVAEGQDKPTETFMARLARAHKVYIQGRVVNRGPDGRGLNQSLTFGPDGGEVARYNKIHPFSFAKEDRYYAGGETPLLIEIGAIRVAPLICYDLRFPEIFRHGVRRGAQCYTVIANWPRARQRHWVTLLQARAIENQAWVVGVNRAGSDPWLEYAGHSLIVDPQGEIVADAGEKEGVITARLDPAALADYRAKFPALNDIRGRFLGE
ncbi:MAG: carbon-nitrogen family hydrolase, partial [Candidatus Competibacteraceae bacterium]|nr:carbon-nitrogen family hydrolase [Candidatus Competibacteraceae bacterium]